MKILGNVARVMFVVGLVIGFSIIGCEPRTTPVTTPQQQVIHISYTANMVSALPNNCKVLEDLGHGWLLIEFPIQGKTKKFLYRAKNMNSETITELKEE